MLPSQGHLTFERKQLAPQQSTQDNENQIQKAYLTNNL